MGTIDAVTPRVGDVMRVLDAIAPIPLAEEWDNVGLLAGDPEKAVDTVLCALELSPEVLREASATGAQMIVTHHPILFRGRKNLREDDAEGAMLCGLVRGGLALAAMHTNFDNAHPGVNDALASALNLRETEGLEHGMCVGTLSPALPLKEFAAQVEHTLGGVVRVFGDPDRLINRVALLGGSGGDFTDQARAYGADAFITGEIGYHKATLAAQEGLCVLEAGHAATENPSISFLCDALQKAFDDVQWNVHVIRSRSQLFL